MPYLLAAVLILVCISLSVVAVIAVVIIFVILFIVVLFLEKPWKTPPVYGDESQNEEQE